MERGIKNDFVNRESHLKGRKEDYIKERKKMTKMYGPSYKQLRPSV